MIAAPGTGRLICPLFDAILKSPSSGPISQQYASAATVPLIKSPSLWLPKPVCAFRGIVALQLMEIQVELPNDIHPLPEDITAYVSPLPARTPVLMLAQFVYPFSLEEHVLSLQPQPHEAIAQRRARNAAILHQREVEEEQREWVKFAAQAAMLMGGTGDKNCIESHRDITRPRCSCLYLLLRLHNLLRVV